VGSLLRRPKALALSDLDSAMSALAGAIDRAPTADSTASSPGWATQRT
jgi:hypothetical protein